MLPVDCTEKNLPVNVGIARGKGNYRGVKSKCRRCEKEFAVRTARHFYCSSSCRTAHYEELGMNGTAKTMRLCAYCQNAFMSRRVRAIFCRPSCSKAHAAVRAKESYRVKTLKKPRVKTRHRAKPVIYQETTHDCRMYNEKEFHGWFEKSYFLFGIRRLLANDSRCPDVIAEMMDGRILMIELEFHASNFRDHRHDPNMVDLIISFARSFGQTRVLDIPVLSLFEVKNHEKGTTSIDWNTRKLTPEFASISEKIQALTLQPRKE
jgi:hypothetical protein